MCVFGRCHSLFSLLFDFFVPILLDPFPLPLSVLHCDPWWEVQRQRVQKSKAQLARVHVARVEGEGRTREGEV